MAPSTRVRTASTIAWLWGILTALSSLALPVRGLDWRYLLPLVLLVAVGIALCVAGYWLRKGRRLGAWIIFVVSGPFVLAEAIFRFGTSAALVGIAVHVALIALAASAWSELVPRGAARASSIRAGG